MSRIEIRPHVPVLGALPVFPDPRPRMARCRLVVDRWNGTAEWQGERKRQEPVTLRVGNAPGELAEIVRIVYPSTFPSAAVRVLVGRVLLVDSTGRVLARTEQQPQVVFEQAWPFSVLDASGLPVREQRFHNTRLAQKTFPGAARAWPLTAGRGWFLLTMTLGLSVLFGLAALLVVLTGWSA